MRHRLPLLLAVGVMLAEAACAHRPRTASLGPQPQAAPASQSSPGIDSPVGGLLDNPATRAVIDRDLPGLSTNSHLDMIRTMTLRQIAQFPQADITPEKLQAIQADLAAISNAPAAAPDPQALPPMSPPNPTPAAGGSQPVAPSAHP